MFYLCFAIVHNMFSIVNRYSSGSFSFLLYIFYSLLFISGKMYFCLCMLKIHCYIYMRHNDGLVLYFVASSSPVTQLILFRYQPLMLQQKFLNYLLQLKILIRRAFSHKAFSTVMNVQAYVFSKE